MTPTRHGVRYIYAADFLLYLPKEWNEMEWKVVSVCKSFSFVGSGSSF